MTKSEAKATPKMVVVARPKAGLHTVPFNRVSQGANPRTTFDDKSIDELAASIAVSGILHNLVVRRVPNARRNGYEVIVGERRLRAVGVLVEAGTWPADTPIPVRVVDMDDHAGLRIALVENVQRDDLHPLDEGAGYVRLVAAGDTTKVIAQAVGKTQRHVQLRLALVEKLSNPTKVAFRQGDVTLAQARVLTLCGAKGQKMAVERIAEGWWDNTQELKEALTGNLPPLEWAIFDRSLYTGKIVEDPDDPASGWFADEAQARRLQEAAIREKAVWLAEAGYSWVKVVWGNKGEHFDSWKYASSKNKKKAGAVVAVNRDLTITVHTDLVEKPKLKTVTGAADPATAPAKTAPPPFTKDHLTHCHAVKTRALQDAIAGAPKTALRLICLALLGATNNVRISADRHGYGEVVVGGVPADRLEDFRREFGKVVVGKNMNDGQQGLLRVHSSGAYTSDKTEAAAWAVLTGLSDDDLLALLAAMVAARCGTFDSYDPTVGDRSVAVTLGAELGVDVATSWRIDAAFLEGCRKPALLNIIAGLGIRAAVKKDNGLGTAKAMRASILKHLPKTTPYVPPTMRLASGPAILKALAAKPKKEKTK